ncbi:hypothetical protein [Lactococcus lactis]|uniref:hypothetical protein n=1 Tax=Lactococcus lactis TaxID=1358 RepID=UPI003A802F4E
MKILELNQESFSLKNIILKFDELNHNEMSSLQKKLYRNGSLTRLAPDSWFDIETYYNTKRMHSGLDYKSPKDFEKYNS